MSTDFELYEDNIRNITSADDTSNRLKTLDALLCRARLLKKDEIANIATRIQLDNLFQFLYTNEKEQQVITSSILKLFLKCIDPYDVIINYDNQIYKLLEQDNPDLKEFGLYVLKKISRQKNSLARVIENVSVLKLIISCMDNENLRIVKFAKLFLLEVGKEEYGLKVLYSKPLLHHFTSLADKNLVFACRIFELVVDISKHSEMGLNESHNCDILPSFLRSLSMDDELGYLGSLEIITDFATSNHCLHYLRNHNFLEKLATDLAVSIKSTGCKFSALCPGLLHCFGEICTACPRLFFVDFASVVNLVFEAIHDDNCAYSDVATSTISVFGMSPEGKIALQRNFRNEMEEYLNQIRSLFYNLVRHKTQILYSVARLMHLEYNVQTDEVLKICEEWFYTFFPNLLKDVMDIIHQPFLEHKVPALQVLQEISSQPWGQCLIRDTPGCIELLLDYDKDADNEYNAVKFSVIKVIMNSPTMETIFSKEIVNSFEAYIQRGVIQINADAQVAIEESL